jgi:hypothetical protein
VETGGRRLIKTGNNIQATGKKQQGWPCTRKSSNLEQETELLKFAMKMERGVSSKILEHNY